MTTRPCARCADPFTSAKGRRLCDACRAKRAAFFICPSCDTERETHSATRNNAHEPVQCWDCRQGELTEARTAVIVDHVARVAPTLDRAVIDAAVARAAPSRVERKWLTEHFAAHPDALTSGAANAPQVLGRLARALLDTGADVRMPRCAGCGRAAMLVATTATGRVCGPCDHDTRKTSCATCGEIRRVHTRLPDGRAVCRTCMGRDHATWEPCTHCGRTRPVNARTKSRAAVCASCYTRHLQPRRTCDGCGTVALIEYNTTDGRSLCRRCHDRRRTCGACGQRKRIKLRATPDHPDLCGACHWGTIAACTRCGDLAEGFGARRGEHACLRCIARRRLDELLAGRDGHIADQLHGLRDAFFAVEQPRSIFVWLDRSPGAQVLHQLAAGELALTHQALDQLPQTPSLRHLHQLLIATGALPERDVRLARLERAVVEIVASLEHPDDTRLLRTFARWRVVNRLRRRADDSGVSVSAAKNARARVAECARFLDWLRHHDTALADCRQADVDNWLAHGGRYRQLIGNLIDWAAERGLAPDDLDAPSPRSEIQARLVDRDERWAIARRLLHDSDLDPADRVAGALVVLYAQPLTRIARLRLSDIVDLDGDIHISFGKDHVHMPAALGDLLRQLPWRRQIGPSGTVPGAGQWLFPGRQAGQPQHPEYLAVRLRALGIDARTQRSAALLQLATQLPPVVLADLLNLHVNTAVRWVKTANGDWANYAATRARTATPE